VYYRKDRAAWAVSYIDASGKRQRRIVEAHTRPQAVNVLSAIKTAEERARTLGVRPSSEVTTAALMERYRRYQKARLSATTFARLDGVIAVLCANLPELAKAITRKDVAEYISFRTATVKPATIFKEVTTLKHALRLAVEWDLLHTNVALGAALPKAIQGRTRYLSPSELKAALRAAPEWLRPPIALAAFTGMRRGELLSLCWKDVDFAGRRLYLRETKNGSLRVLVLNELSMRVLESLPMGAPGDPVLPGIDGMRLTDNTRHLFKRLGIDGASFHSLRHTAASQMVMQGVDLYAVGQMLGHRSPAMTQRYAHLSPQYMAAAAGKLDAVFGEVMPKTITAGNGADSCVGCS
jgi:integrase